MTRWLASALAACACGAPVSESTDAGARAEGPFASSVTTFTPGEAAGFGQSAMPDVVLGAPRGSGANAGSLDVVSLGRGGSIVLAFDRDIVDGPGPDFIVFENAFVVDDQTAFREAGIVAASEDGTTFAEWPCAAADEAGRFPGCAGVNPTLSSPSNGVDPTDVARAGGDAFDLADVGLARARYVRITDGGHNRYGAPSGGFDLDAIAVIHEAP